VVTFVSCLLSLGNLLSDNILEENFSSVLSSYLKSCKCSSKDKIQFLDEFVKDIEKEIEVLKDQEIPLTVQFQGLFFEASFQ
jgi:hypothetical protein